MCYGSNGTTKCYIVVDLEHSSNQILSILNKDFRGFPYLQCNNGNIFFLQSCLRALYSDTSANEDNSFRNHIR